VRQKRILVEALQADYKVSHRRVCAVVLSNRSFIIYKPVDKNEEALRTRMRDIAAVRVKYGFWRIHVLLRREGWKDKHRRTYRIYRDEGLNLRSKRPLRNRAAAHRLKRPDLCRIYQCCSMDFIHDQLFDGRKFLILTLVDNLSRKCLALHICQSLKGSDVVEVLEGIRSTITSCLKGCKSIMALSLSLSTLINGHTKIMLP
jgi:putative transposase